MKLFLRDNDLSDWVKVGEGVEIKIEYPTPRQEAELMAKLSTLRYMEPEESGRLEIIAQYYGLLIKYCVKDWRGITDERTDEEVKCKLNYEGTELDAQLWGALMANPFLAEAWGGEIKRQIDFTPIDKKKLVSADTSTTTETSKAGRRKSTR